MHISCCRVRRVLTDEKSRYFLPSGSRRNSIINCIMESLKLIERLLPMPCDITVHKPEALIGNFREVGVLANSDRTTR